jgi:hypothetical protein
LVDELLAMSLPVDARSLADLPPPQILLGRLSATRLRKLAAHFQGLWSYMAESEDWPKLNGSAGADGEDANDEGGFWAVLRTVGSYYGECLFRYAADAGPEDALAFLDELKPDDPATAESDAVEREIERQQAATLLSACNNCASNLFLAASIDEMGFQPGELVESYDADLTAVDAVERLHLLWGVLDGEPLALANSFVASSLAYRKAIIRKRFERRQKALHAPTAFVSFREFVLLSSRHEYMAKKYGEKKIERTFEQQVNAIFQTFGFVVISARPGEPVADLLCISREHHFCFLVDAKTSAKPYSFPKGDQRAIADYVRDLTKELPELPPLAFVLLVGPKPANTVPEKMGGLERQLGVPVRFAEAAVIAMLQQSMAGRISAQHFRDAVIASAPILSDSIADRLKETLDVVVAAYTSFVRTLRQVSI